MELKNIKIEENVWWKLNKLKVEWRLKKLSQVISKLIKEKGEK
jgi:predicted CopG family antitoxin